MRYTEASEDVRMTQEPWFAGRPRKAKVPTPLLTTKLCAPRVTPQLEPHCH